MTLDEFFRKLPRAGWKLTPGGAIRACKDGRCPLELVARVRVGHHCQALTRLDLWPTRSSMSIVGAADGTNPNARRLRARLLRHCGLAKLGRK
jgi:hypothetical protein